MTTDRKKIRVCLLFGGRSGEHEVSLQSAKSVYEALDQSKYDIKLVGIDKQGHWLPLNESHYLLHETNPKLISLNTAAVQQEQTLFKPNEPTQVTGVDVFFPVMHGTYGEDGSIQGMLELMQVAYVGAGVLGSAVGMDKDVMKRLLKVSHIPTARYKTIRKHEPYQKAVSGVIKQLGLPLFVKPANLGSSVGITKVHTQDELLPALEHAFQFDTKVLIEECINGREIECSVLGNENPMTSVLGEIIPSHEFYSYEAKYIDEHGAALRIPAKLSAFQTQQVQTMAIEAFKVLECEGMARVDFFLTNKGKLYVNEINTIPGFTKISMYPKLWEASGISYPALLDKLIQLAIERKNKKDRLVRSYP
ncbi:D-alanine--D-alanine ligase [Candidatus Roizmanbacteria bacterium CG10_big_fil_rev_8_21_14_0_10_45_7]|uniref:D-alanine--D-alanine ligase n=1 Tax=Candidatus Roizmanbacteria bacterium CG10_big_fil_rev_8_21_14_0_10_45_7 TaxID=1974854 RepID=A0A2M8KVB5_9BACT|nr:MAG: D-alanine--D-alanine ligase [Candidatus Roizmanbacteria bacterium CG10_big_fil_rev_8_21_14_0_10_45_7]